MMANGLFTIPTRVYLTQAQREQLLHIVQQHDITVHELVSELLVSFLDHVPVDEQEEVLAPVPDPQAIDADIRKRRMEIRRLRTRVQSSDAAPAWIAHYVADLEAEIRRLEELR